VAVLKEEPAGPRVERKIESGQAIVSSISLGEAYYSLAGKLPVSEEGRVRAAISALRDRVTLDEPDWPLVLSAAQLKARNAISYADSFCVATARRHRVPLWTGDPEIIALAELVDVVDLREEP